MNKKTVEQVDVQGKKVFVRVDFNVPIKQGVVKDDTRIRESLPTLKYLLERNATLILASHLGRPKGKVNPEYSIAPAAPVLEKLLGRPVTFVNDCVGPKVQQATANAAPGSVFLLENLRFYPGEEANDPAFAKQLASPAQVYVNDAFGTAARAHASTVGMVSFLPTACCGFLMVKELDYLGKLLQSPERPFSVVLGGAKISDKIEVVQNLIKIADNLLIGGGMVYTFLASQGYTVGDSICERDKLDLAASILKETKTRQMSFLMPMDHIVSRSLEQPVDMKVLPAGNIPDGMRGVDIGPGTVQQYQKILRGSKTIFWNGPMGVFEVEAFANGTTGVARAVADSGATSVIGGGDSIAAVAKAGVTDKITHISTGGGASLEFLAGEPLPGVEALPNR